MTEQLPLLQLHHITKKFGNKLALDDISLKLTDSDLVLKQNRSFPIFPIPAI